MWDKGTKASGWSLVPSPGHALAWEDLSCVLRGIGTPVFHHHVSGCLMEALGRLPDAPYWRNSSMLEKNRVYSSNREMMLWTAQFTLKPHLGTEIIFLPALQRTPRRGHDSLVLE